jgi:four helix bundle protein
MNDKSLASVAAGPVHRFDHHNLAAYGVALDALTLGEQLVKPLPRGSGPLVDQLRRALTSAFLNIAEASARTAADRGSRFRCARAEACEAASALEAMQRIGLVGADAAEAIIALLHRLVRLLTGLARMR